jgi:tetratricopeptide (TPR) repeat protein
MKTHEMHDWLKAGAYYRNKGNYEKALESFAQARLALLCEMGECLTCLGQLDEGRVLFEEVLEANSADIRANAGIGIVSLLVEDYRTAEVAFGNVLHMDESNAKALCGMGMVKKAIGQLEESYSLLLQSLEMDPGQKTALQALAEVGWHLGAVDTVLPLLRKYLKRFPDDAEIAADLHTLENEAQQISAGLSDSEQLEQALVLYRAAPDNLENVNLLLKILVRMGCTHEALGVRDIYMGRNPGNTSVLLQF